MSKQFTPEAAKYVKAALCEMDREWLMAELLALAIEPSEDETDEELAEALVSSVECGDTHFPLDYDSSRQFSHRTSMMYLDIDEVYQD